IGKQKNDRRDAAFFDRERLRRDESLLRQIRVDEERLHAERVGPLLLVAESVALLEPWPERRVAGRADRDRLALEIAELLDAGVRDDDGRILLKRRGDRRHRNL